MQISHELFISFSKWLITDLIAIHVAKHLKQETEIELLGYVCMEKNSYNYKLSLIIEIKNIYLLNLFINVL